LTIQQPIFLEIQGLQMDILGISNSSIGCVVNDLRLQSHRVGLHPSFFHLSVGPEVGLRAQSAALSLASELLQLVPAPEIMAARM
jgi:hypothetical protein